MNTSVKATTKSAAAIIIATTIIGLYSQKAEAQASAGIIGIDHVGINVPDIKQALGFFDDVLGFSPVTTLGPIPLDAAWKEGNHMHTETGALTIKMINAGSGASIEIFSYENNHGSKLHPGGDDIGASHIAFYTHDINSSVEYLKSKGITIIGEPFHTTAGDTAGESWVYFLSPWGAKFELVSYPQGKGYEKNSPKKILWSPKDVQHQDPTKNESLSSEAVNLIVDKHLALWNEQDVVHREVIMKEIYSDQITMVDRHFIAQGHQEVDGFIKDLQQKNPDFKFSHVKPLDAHHNVARLYWQVGNKKNPAVVTGMDLFVIEQGKVKQLYVFVNEGK